MALTAGVFPSMEKAKQSNRLLLDSADKYYIDVLFYGIGFPHFPSWCELKIKMQLDYIEANRRDYTHVLYTDGRDSFFTAPLAEVIEKYEPYQNEIVASCGRMHQGGGSDVAKYLPEVYGGYHNFRSHYVYPHVGGYIGPIDLVIETKRQMWAKRGDRIDDMYVWHDAWMEGYFRPRRDMDCKIFQVIEHGTTDEDLTIRDGRLYNKSQEQYPCILHLTGGYSDPIGLSKPERLLPWFARIHPELTIA